MPLGPLRSLFILAMLLLCFVVVAGFIVSAPSRDAAHRFVLVDSEQTAETPKSTTVTHGDWHGGGFYRSHGGKRAPNGRN